MRRRRGKDSNFIVLEWVLVIVIFDILEHFAARLLHNLPRNLSQSQSVGILYVAVKADYDRPVFVYKTP